MLQVPPNLVLSSSVGSSPAPVFNSGKSTGGFPFDFSLDFSQKGPIARVDLCYTDNSDIIESMSVVYNCSDGTMPTAGPYGTSSASIHTFNLSKDEVILSVAGLWGTKGHSTGILQLSFTKIHRGSGAMSTSDVYGVDVSEASTTTPFYACGPIVALPANSDPTTDYLGSISFVAADTPFDKVQV